VRQKGARGSIDHDATDAILEAFAAATPGSTVFFHPGIYKISERLVLSLDRIRILGPGAKILLGASLGVGDGACMLYITGNYNEVEQIEFDGNVAQAYAGKSRCIQINGTTPGTGSNNRISRVYCHDTYNDPGNDQSSDLIQIVNGTDNVVERSLCERA
jgi:hypothetical protein